MPVASHRNDSSDGCSFLTYVKLQESVNLRLQDRHALQQLLSGHGPHHTLSTGRTQRGCT